VHALGLNIPRKALRFFAEASHAFLDLFKDPLIGIVAAEPQFEWVWICSNSERSPLRRVAVAAVQAVVAPSGSGRVIATSLPRRGRIGPPYVAL